MVLTENFLSSDKSLKHGLLANDLRNVANWSPDRVTRHRIPEQEEHIFTLKVEVGLFVLLKQVDRAGFVQVNRLELGLINFAHDLVQVF